MVQIGFRLPKMNTEGHDTLFAVAENKEAAFKQIKEARPYAAHIDDKHQLDDGIDDVLCVRDQLENYGIQITKEAAQENELTIEYIVLK